MRSDYKRWLEGQGYSHNTINTQCSHASRVEQAYGNLDQLYAADRLEGVLETLKYSTAEARRGAPNPSTLSVNGDLYKGLAGLRTAVGLYRRFLEESGTIGVLPSAPQPRHESSESDGRERIGLERDLQKALRREIAQLEPGLRIIDDGVERAVPSGFIDITAVTADGTLVVIELKAGVADRTAVGQILSYMGDLLDAEGTEIRGILIAHTFDEKARPAPVQVCP